ncbi:MAG: hypothetical protein IPM57_06540 [Oligoflexia bacterium]|nr:hypothetical protein [Oligoflexia bacterium]
MKRLLLTLCLLLLTLNTNVSLAHELSLPPSPYIKAATQYHELFETLDQILEESRLYGATVAEEKQIAYVEKLLSVVHTQIQDAANELGEPHVGEKIWQTLKINIFQHFNYVKIFKFVKDTARKVGPKFAVAMATTEILENSLYLLTAMDAKYAVLLPLSWFHAIDVVVYGAFFGIPEVIKKVKTYSRFGGFFEGMNKYYAHLVKQKKILPLDWSEVIDLEKVVAKIGSDKVFLDVVVLKNSVLERFLSNKLQKIILPRRVAQRETSIAITVRDLERIAKQLEIPVYMYKGVHQKPAIYSSFLLKDIISHEFGFAHLITYVADLGYSKYFNKNIIENPRNASGVAAATSAEELSYIGETPDILSQRLIWFYEDQIERVRNSSQTTKIDFKHLRAINRIVQKDLRRIAETKYRMSSNPKSFQELFEINSKITEMLKKFESKPDLCKLLLITKT